MELRTLSDCERYLDGFVNRERMATFDYAGVTDKEHTT